MSERETAGEMGELGELEYLYRSLATLAVEFEDAGRYVDRDVMLLAQLCVERLQALVDVRDAAYGLDGAVCNGDTNEINAALVRLRDRMIGSEYIGANGLRVGGANTDPVEF